MQGEHRIDACGLVGGRMDGWRRHGWTVGGWINRWYIDWGDIIKTDLTTSIRSTFTTYKYQVSVEIHTSRQNLWSLLWSKGHMPLWTEIKIKSVRHVQDQIQAMDLTLLAAESGWNQMNSTVKSTTRKVMQLMQCARAESGNHVWNSYESLNS